MQPPSLHAPNMFSFTALKLSPALTISIALQVPGTVGPGSFGLNDNLNAVVGGNSILEQWQALPGLLGGRGPLTLTITSLTAAATSGAFSFDAPPNSATATVGTKVVRNGAFTIAF